VTVATLDSAAAAVGRTAPPHDRPLVCIQGLGFVGAAMAVAVASATINGKPRFNVIGVDLPTPRGQERIDTLNAGGFPVATTDEKLESAMREVHERGNLIATSDQSVFALASACVVDIPLDLDQQSAGPVLATEPFRSAIRTLADHIRGDCLVLVETTVPPGTCERIVAPELAAGFARRGIGATPLVAHCYERVMPGPGYLDSIVNFWRVYAGVTEEAADAAERFLTQIINVSDYPLTRLASTTASETGKLLENSYRATTIAFAEEWGRFAEAVGIDLFEVIDAIRVRPTHSNMREPGFGVGGYCLTKDPLFAWLAARDFLGRPELDFPFCRQAVAVNHRMPLVSLDRVQSMMGGSLVGCRILLLGVSYQAGVGDTRSSPSETFVLAARERGAQVSWHDPMVGDWYEIGETGSVDLPSPEGFDVVVFAVAHRDYQELDLRRWLGDQRPMIFDANRVLTQGQRRQLVELSCRFASIGRGTD
jgi:UDP-N-acetyl-D-glucosamine dehydrogenase